MKKAQDAMGVKKMSDLILKEILGICGTKNAMKKQMEE